MGFIKNSNDKYGAIPEELKRLPNWICWNAVYDEDRGKIKNSLSTLRQAAMLSRTTPIHGRIFIQRSRLPKSFRVSGLCSGIVNISELTLTVWVRS